MDVMPLPTPRPKRLCVLAISVVLSTTPACRALLEGDDGRECSTTSDCLDGQRCEIDRGRCVPSTGSPPDATVEAGLPDATVEAGLPDATAEAGLPDARPDGMSPDLTLPDLSIPDLAVPDVLPPDVLPPDVLPPDAGISSIYGEAGDCFPGEQRGALAASTGAPVPRAVCTGEALLWTTTDAAGQTTLTSRRGETDRPLFTLPPTAPFLAVGGVVLVEMPDPLRDGRTAVFRLDLADGPGASPVAVLPGPVDQWHAARGPAVTGLVQGDDAASAVVLVFDDGRTLRCGEAERRQWGLALTETMTAWFEQPGAGGAVDLVVVAGPACGPTLRMTVPTGVEAGDRLVADGTSLFWLATDAASRSRRLHTIDTARPGDGPRAVVADGLAALNPVEFAVHDGWLLLSAFENRAYRLHLFDLTTGARQPPARPGSARAPSLSGTVALWAEQIGGSPWEIRHERLPFRRR